MVKWSFTNRERLRERKKEREKYWFYMLLAHLRNSKMNWKEH
jgi:hypothetical protein